ncbi:MAG: hypothetical protein V3R66_05800 [Rhodospirillales bacterium]
MNNKVIGFEILNAYVDNELDRASAAKVSLAIAGDPHLAKQAAVLTRLRSAVIENAQSSNIRLHPASVIGNRPGIGMLAASIALLTFITGSILLSFSYDHPALPQWFTVAANSLESWPNEPDEGIPSTDLIEPVALVNGSLARVYIPDLTAAKLFINHIEERTSTSAGSLKIIGYRGTRGCRVVLVVFVDSISFPAEMTLARDGLSRAYAWRAGPLGYSIIADGMDVSRFRLIVETVFEATRRHQAVDAETRVALGESRKNSASCLT